jgi:YebC/PmpR family DNA-binding regulatory protein
MGRMFEARKATIFARNNRMAKAFTRVSREIAVAVKAGGPNPDANPALRRAIQNGRSVSMPREKIEGAIKRALGPDTADYQEAFYEGYAEHGIAVMVVASTDNPARTAANVRLAFRKNGGNMGATGSVAFMFNRMGVFRIKPENIPDPEELELEMIDHGLEEMGESTDDNDEDVFVLRCAFENFGTLQDGIENAKIEVASTALEHVAETLMELSDEQAESVMKMVAALEADDDVQHVFHNLA